MHNNTLDTTGLRCPEPLMLLRKTLRKMAEGEILLVISDDLITVRDFNNFCNFTNHTLLKSQTEHKPFKFWIKKSS